MWTNRERSGWSGQFADRRDAGRQLACELEKFRVARPLVLGLPRGGVVVAAEVARALGCDLDVLLVKKLRCPDNPELAIGALSESGHRYVNDELVRAFNIEPSYLEAEVAERAAEIREQQRLYRAVKPRIAPTDRAAVLVDDGLATGATMIAAAQAIALERPKLLIVAVPVGSPEAARALQGLEQVDEVICPHTPDWFEGVGQFFKDFVQVEDSEVVRILAELVDER